MRIFKKKKVLKSYVFFFFLGFRSKDFKVIGFYSFTGVRVRGTVMWLFLVFFVGFLRSFGVLGFVVVRLRRLWCGVGMELLGRLR